MEGRIYIYGDHAQSIDWHHMACTKNKTYMHATDDAACMQNALFPCRCREGEGQKTDVRPVVSPLRFSRTRVRFGSLGELTRIQSKVCGFMGCIPRLSFLPPCDVAPPSRRASGARVWSLPLFSFDYYSLFFLGVHLISVPMCCCFWLCWVHAEKWVIGRGPYSDHHSWLLPPPTCPKLATNIFLALYNLKQFRDIHTRK